MENNTKLAQYGNWQAWRVDGRSFVRDIRSGFEFNCNSASHAVSKAQKNAAFDGRPPYGCFGCADYGKAEGCHICGKVAQ